MAVASQKLAPPPSKSERFDNAAPARIESEYRGLKIWATANLHSESMRVINTLGLSRGSQSLDLGAGEGAFSLRLQDHGFAVTAAELELNKFRADAPCYNFDLNLDFHDKLSQKFDLVVGIELIEHLQNPRHFIGNCLRLLNDNGALLVTSPNLESWVSRIRFLRDSRFLWFDESDYQKYGHITPIFSWQIEQICREFDARVVRFDHTPNELLWDSVGAGLLGKLTSKIMPMSVLYPLMKGRKHGEISIFVIRKNPTT